MAVITSCMLHMGETVFSINLQKQDSHVWIECSINWRVVTQHSLLVGSDESPSTSKYYQLFRRTSVRNMYPGCYNTMVQVNTSSILHPTMERTLGHAILFPNLLLDTLRRFINPFQMVQTGKIICFTSFYCSGCVWCS